MSRLLCLSELLRRTTPYAVSTLMAVPSAKGLFAKAIGESGGAFSDVLPMDTLEAREKKDDDFVATLGVKSLAELRALPGVGAYTAAAVAAIAFGRQTAPVDGNIARVLARLLAMEKPIAGARVELAAAARVLAPSRRAGDFAQALMDIGATLCRPQSPACNSCPLAQDCTAFQAGVPEVYPRRDEAKVRPRRQGAVFFARRSDGAFLARRRPPRGLLASTIELPGTPWTSKNPDDGLAGAAPVDARWRRLPGDVEQVFTHFALRLTVYAAEFEGGAPADCFWVKPDAIGAAGFSSMMRKAVKHALTQT